jgi:hypothetical protein
MVANVAACVTQMIGNLGQIASLIDQDKYGESKYKDRLRKAILQEDGQPRYLYRKSKSRNSYIQLLESASLCILGMGAYAREVARQINHRDLMGRLSGDTDYTCLLAQMLMITLQAKAGQIEQSAVKVALSHHINLYQAESPKQLLLDELLLIIIKAKLKEKTDESNNS